MLVLLVQASKHHVLAWKLTRYAGERYCAKDTGGVIRVVLHQPWLYQKNGVGLASQLAVVTVGKTNVWVACGTKEMQLIWDLLSAGVGPVPGYEVFERNSTHAADGGGGAQLIGGNNMTWQSKYDLVLEHLSLLYHLTTMKVISWKRERRSDAEAYYANTDGTTCLIEFFSPLIGETAVAKNALVRVTVGSGTCSFVSGTEGMYFVEEILAAGLTQWRNRLKKEEEEATQSLAVLRKLIAHK